MLLSLKRSSSKNQGWDCCETNEGTVDPPTSPTTFRGGVRFSKPTFRVQTGDIVPIPMDIIHLRDGRC